MDRFGIESREVAGENHGLYGNTRDEQAETADRSDAHTLGNLVLLCRLCHQQAERGELEFDSTLDPPE